MIRISLRPGATRGRHSPQQLLLHQSKRATNSESKGQGSLRLNRQQRGGRGPRGRCWRRHQSGGEGRSLLAARTWEAKLANAGGGLRTTPFSLNRPPFLHSDQTHVYQLRFNHVRGRSRPPLRKRQNPPRSCSHLCLSRICSWHSQIRIRLAGIVATTQLKSAHASISFPLSPTRVLLILKGKIL